MTNDTIILDDTEKKAFCICNGMSEEQYEKLLRDGYSVDEIFESAKEIVLRGESLAEAGAFKPKRAADFTESRTRFVWYPYIPIGDYTVLMADGGTGKTIFCCGVLAALSNGKLLPGETNIKPPYTVLIISAEDRGELLKERLQASGADLERVHILDCMDSEGLNFTDREREFTELIRSNKYKLVIIDPWHAFLGADVDINRVNAVRPVFQRLANIAKDCDCGLVLVSHVNKRAQGENANNAATGSTDFVNAARSAMRVIFSEEPDGENCRIVVHTKSNYAQAGESVKFRINDKGGCVWAGFSEITRRTLEEAARWRKKPGEVISSRNEAEERNRALIEAICEKAIDDTVVRVTYDELKEEYGEDIFGMSQPKRAIDCVVMPLKELGISVEAPKIIKRDKTTKKGFSIFKKVTTQEAIEGYEK